MLTRSASSRSDENEGWILAVAVGAFCLIPVAVIAAIHAYYYWTWFNIGEEPTPEWDPGFHHLPSITAAAVPVALVNTAALIVAIGCFVLAGRPRLANRLAIVTVIVWSMCVGVYWCDPFGAVEWWID